MSLRAPNPSSDPAQESSFWLARMSRTIFFLVVVLSLAGVYAAFQVPTAVFPDTNFPRVVIGVDNGVMPVEQMQVTITKPIEDAVNSVPGLLTVRSTTSRGSAEVSLFFDWNVDMFHTLQLADAALSKVRQTLPATAVITTNRLTFATFPILGYALTADNRGPDTISPTRLWEIATYDLKPPLNRVDGVSTVTVQGGQVPEVHIVPDLARLENSGVTLTDLVNAVQNSNIIESPGLYQANHELILALVGAQAHDIAHLASLVVKTTPSGAPVRISDVADVHPGTEPVYHTVTANGVPSVLLNIARQPTSNTVAVANSVAAEVAQLSRTLPAGVHLAPFYDQSRAGARVHRQRARRHLHRACAGLHDSLPLSARLVQFAGRRPGNSCNRCGYDSLSLGHRTVLQFDDPGRSGCRYWVSDRRRHRGGGEHRRASRRGPVAHNRHPHCAARTRHSAGLFDDYSSGCLPSSHRNNGRHRQLLPRAGRHHDRGPAHLACPRRHLHSRALAVAAGRPQARQRQTSPAALSILLPRQGGRQPRRARCRAFRHCTAPRRPLACSRARGTCGRPRDAAHSQRPCARIDLGADPADRSCGGLPRACCRHLVCLQRAWLRPAARDGRGRVSFSTTSRPPAHRSPRPTASSSTSSRSCAARRRSRSPAAAPAFSLASPPSPRQTPATSAFASSPTATATLKRSWPTSARGSGSPNPPSTSSSRRSCRT